MRYTAHERLLMASRKAVAFGQMTRYLKKEQVMADNQEKPVIDALRDANQTLVENLLSTQERNLKYAQGIFASTIEVLKSNVASTRSILEKQQETFQKLSPVPTSSSDMAAYSDLIRLPLTSFQQMLDLLETTSQEALQSFQKATENFEQVTQQGLKQWQEAAQQLQRNVEKPGQEEGCKQAIRLVSGARRG